MSESSAVAVPASGLLSPELERILFNDQERRVFLEKLRTRLPPPLYLTVDNWLATVQCAAEHLRWANVTMDDLRRILAQGEAELKKP
jgi:hypothetical protein